MDAVVPDRTPDRPPVRHYFHVYADGDAKNLDLILREHFRAVDRSRMVYDSMVFGIVGTPRNRARVREYLPPGRVHEWQRGFEQRTLAVLHDDVQDGLDGYVMYAHSKGAGYPVPWSAAWRRCMTKHVVVRAADCVRHLNAGADVAGPHWLDPRDYPRAGIPWPHFAGNFWWATTEHIRKLGPLNGGDLEFLRRFDAESWLGTVRPERVADLVKGWPGPTCHKHLGGGSRGGTGSVLARSGPL
jgi:hypothetical protein